MLTRRRFIGGVGVGVGSAALGGCGASNAAPFWYSYGGKPRDVLLALIDAFHGSESEHRISPVYQGDYFETLAKIRTAMHVGLAPALTHVVGESLPYLVDAGALVPLEGICDEATLVPALTQEGMFGSPIISATTHALPFNRSTPIAYIDEEAFAEAGLEPPNTWDELISTARALTRGEGAAKRHGFACAIDWWFWVALVEQAGGALFDENGKPTLATAEAEEAIELWRMLVSEGVMRPPPGRDYNAWQVVNSDFIERKAAMIWTSTAYLRYFDTNAKFAFRCAPLPMKRRRAVPTGGTFFVMPRGASARHTEAARAFLSFMMQPEQANRFATETGYIPVSASGITTLEDAGYYDAHKNDRVALDQLTSAQKWPWSRSLLRVQREIVQPRLEAAILANRPAREVLDEAQAAAVDDG